MNTSLVILAAGMGSRYGGLKQMDRFGPHGETIMDYSIYDAIRAGFDHVVFVIRRDFENEFREMFVERLQDKIRIDYVFQELNNIPKGFRVPADRTKPWGTAHAVMVAGEKINAPFAVINADDFYGRQAFAGVHDFLVTGPDNREYCVMGYRLQDTLSEHGHVSRGVCETDGSGYLVRLTERTKIARNGAKIEFQEGEKKVTISGDLLVSMNLMGFQTSLFEYLNDYFKEFLERSANDPKAEFFLPSVVNALVDEGKIRVRVVKTLSTWFGVTYQQDKLQVSKTLNRLIEAGEYPDRLWGQD